MAQVPHPPLLDGPARRSDMSPASCVGVTAGQMAESLRMNLYTRTSKAVVAWEQLATMPCSEVKNYNSFPWALKVLGRRYAGVSINAMRNG